MASTAADKKPSFLLPATSYDNNAGVPKSPKSPKITIENPLLKRPQFMLGSTQMVAPNLRTTLRSDCGNHNEARSPLGSLSTNISQTTNKTPGPPPKASLSLMSMSVLPQTEVSWAFPLRDSTFQTDAIESIWRGLTLSVDKRNCSCFRLSSIRISSQCTERRTNDTSTSELTTIAATTIARAKAKKRFTS